MKWESKIHDTREAAFFSDSSNSQDYLVHYGIPGMKWGVRTKEYVKQGYDTLKRRMAIQKRQRQAEAHKHYSEGYRHGQRLAANTAIGKSTVKKPEAKKGATEKIASKVLKQYGLESYSPQVAELIKNAARFSLMQLSKSERGRKAMQTGANAIAKGSGWLLSSSVKASPYVKKGIKTSATYAGKAAKIGGEQFVRGFKWLKSGGGEYAARNATDFLRYLSSNAQKMSKGSAALSKRGSRYLSQLLKRRKYAKGR